jgi:hypothetical protein
MSYRPTAATIAKNHAQYAAGRECRFCHKVKPPSEMKTSYRLVQNVCRSCGTRGGDMLALDNLAVDNAPDPKPAQAVRAILAADRARRRAFDDDRYAEIVEEALSSQETAEDATQWVRALQQWSRDHFRQAYEAQVGSPLPLLTADLVD